MVKGALLILCLNFCPWAYLGAQQPPMSNGSGEEYAFLEMVTARDTYFVQEPIRLQLRVGFDARFFQDNVIQLFRRHLDVPVQLQASWLEDLPGTVILEGEAKALDDIGNRERRSFALNDGLAEAVRVEDRLKDGRRFTVLEIEKNYLPTRPGELKIPEPLLRFAFATRFREDLVGGRVPEDRNDAVVRGGGLILRILPLPERERPPEFTGAVGRLSMEAEADPRDLEVGEILKLVLRIEGEGNLGFFDPPRLDGLRGFHVFGRIEDKDGMRLLVTYDLVPLSEEVQEVPPIPFAFFDTNSPAGYRILRTQSIPLKVRPPPDGALLDLLTGGEVGRAVPGLNDIFGLKPMAALPRGGASRSLSPALLAGGLLLPWLFALGLLYWLRARERLLRDPYGARARRAAAVYRTRAGSPGTNLAETFAEYLAARLHRPAAAVVAPDLASRLVAAGVQAELAARAAKLLENLVSARYGGDTSLGSVDEARTLVDALESTFQNVGMA